MRVFLQVWNEDGRVDSYGPYDGTDCARSMRDAQYWCRTICKAGGVKTCWIMQGQAVQCYRSKGNHGYQKARKIVTIGAAQFPRW